MRLVNGVDARPTPWFWAINGAAGVLAASIAVVVSIAFSISASIWTGAACYLLLAGAGVALIPSWNGDHVVVGELLLVLGQQLELLEQHAPLQPG